MRTACVALIAGVFAFGCGTTRPILTTDLLAARDNFTAAGLTAEAACMQAAVDDIGEDRFGKFQVRGAVSAGSVPYIVYAQLAGSRRQPFPESCDAVLGKVLRVLGKHGLYAVSPLH